MPTKKDFYTITREEAASVLNISMRTLDRYTKNGKLRTHLSPGRNILIHEKDLEKFVPTEKEKRKNSTSNKSATPKKKAAPKIENVPRAEAVEVKTENVEEKVFRELYEETSKDLKQKQEKLEAASFRVGQLEAQLKNSVPLLEHKQQEKEMLSESSRLKEKLVTSILKGWIFLGLAILAIVIAGALGALMWII